MTDINNDAVVEPDKPDSSLTDALEKLSLTTELDSALLNHLSLLDEYMFHVECLSQLFRMVRPRKPPSSGDKMLTRGRRSLT
jgi:hypothetical protein